MIDFHHLEQYRGNNRIEAKKALGGLPRSICIPRQTRIFSGNIIQFQIFEGRFAGRRSAFSCWLARPEQGKRSRQL
jgi:hypothetical protein